jgi:hypothetical protein
MKSNMDGKFLRKTLFIFAFALGLMFAGSARAASDYAATYLQNFSTEDDKDSSATTGNWDTEEKYASLKVAEGTTYESSGTVQSVQANEGGYNVSGAYIKVKADVPEGTAVTYYLSANGGNDWQKFTAADYDSTTVPAMVAFSKQGNDLRWKLELETEDTAQSPTVATLLVGYTGLMTTEEIDEETDGGSDGTDDGDEAVDEGDEEADDGSEDDYIPEDETDISVLQQNALVTSPGDPKVYVIFDGKKKWISTAKEFGAMGYKWENVTTVGAEVLAQYPDLRLAKEDGTDRIYYLTEAGMKRLILNDAIFQSYGDRYEDVVRLEPRMLAAMPTVTFIQRVGDPKVYKLAGYKKRWIPTVKQFLKEGGSWGQLTPVNETEFNTYPTIK